MKKGYHKKINLDGLKINEISRLESLIKKLGYKSTEYKFNYYGTHGVELIITSQELHRDLKTIRRTKYKKSSLKGDS